MTVPLPKDVHEILEVRLCIETFIARELAHTRPQPVLRALEHSIETTIAAYQASDLPRAVASLRVFSEIMASACGNDRMIEILANLRDVLAIIGNASRHAPDRLDRSIAEHTTILAAIRRGDQNAAADATAMHVRGLEHDALAAVAELADRAA